jgi:hypothetical protein
VYAGAPAVLPPGPVCPRTVYVLAMNADDLLLIRAELLEEYGTLT